MTFHAAKGLEFDTVILTGIEEGILPSAHALYNPDSVEEERRLLYVGITRARERLLLMHTKYRYTYGQITDQQPSRFLDEMPDEHVPQVDCSYWKEEDFHNYFSSWLYGHKDLRVSQSIKQAARPIDRRDQADAQTIKPSKLSSFAEPFDDEESANSSWQRHQSVTHKLFGKGVIEKVEQRNTNTILTVRFRSGIKKLDASFIHAV